MKRFLLVITVVAAVAGTVLAAPESGTTRKPAKLSKVPEPEVVRSIALDEVKPGMRVKIQLAYSRPFVGTVTSVSATTVGIDLSTEEGGLPGKLRFRKTDIMVVWDLKPQTDEEKQRVLDRRKETVAKIKVEVTERIEKDKGEEAAEETRAKTEEEDLRKALDVVVKKDDEARMRALLEEYPTEKWSEDTFRQVRENWILRDLQPTPEQSRFLKVFDEWKQARDTLAVIDARAKGQEGDRLLMKFPPSEGWGRPRLDAITAKEAEGAPLTDDETEFKKSWSDWSSAAERRAGEVAAKRAGEAGEETGEKPAEKIPEKMPEPAPVEKTPEPAPTEKAPEEKAPEKPADVKPETAPAPEKPVEPTPAETAAPEKPEEKAPAPPAPEKAPDAPAPEKAPETPPADKPAE